ncbi:unnamed protein product [Protopolystoma xenopodis]|uniref:Piezo non-specific cation channel cap domain-containing protein n=1 Tax=Protopolystoma xenopodis TaxID=117903 RepID=A0A448XN67_9PLAT|nr:unnamed protein product [Protopolystoma xenopodis]
MTKVIGIYAGYIFVIHRLFRNIYSDLSYVVKYAEMPHVDRILNLCHEIYLVRENRLLHLEEQLICKLIFLYRSSETLIKWTRHPKRIIDHFTGNLDVQPFSPYPPLPPPPPYPSPTLLSVSGSVSGSNMQTGSNASGFSIARHRAAGPLSSASEGHLEGFDYPPNQRQYLYSGLQSPIHIPISRQHVQSHYYRNQHSMPYPSRQLEESDLLLGTYGGVLEQSRWPTADNHNICADPTDSLNQAGASQASRAPVFSKSQSKQLGHAMEAKTSTETQEKDCRVILTTDQPLRVAQHPSSGSHVQQVQKQKHQQQQLHQQLRRRVRPVIEESQ